MSTDAIYTAVEIARAEALSSFDDADKLIAQAELASNDQGSIIVALAIQALTAELRAIWIEHKLT